MIKLTIQSNGVVYNPIIEEGINWDTEIKGVPGKLTFTVVKDSIINFQEGDLVKFSDNDRDIFYGFVFTKKRDKDQNISVTAYDQLRYFKNKHTCKYNNKTASEFIKMLASDFYLNIGEIADTEYIIDSRNEDNTTLFDMVETALDLTLQNEKKIYILYDDFGKLVLKDIKDMKLDFVVNGNNCENYSYTSSIDAQTYNSIKLSYDSKETGEREIYPLDDPRSIATWGVLQYCEKVQENTNVKVKADILLEMYNKKTRNLTVSNVLGNSRVRAGSRIGVNLELGDINVQNCMIVERAKHTYKNNEHLMDLTLKGGEFIA